MADAMFFEPAPPKKKTEHIPKRNILVVGVIAVVLAVLAYWYLFLYVPGDGYGTLGPDISGVITRWGIVGDMIAITTVEIGDGELKEYAFQFTEDSEVLVGLLSEREILPRKRNLERALPENVRAGGYIEIYLDVDNKKLVDRAIYLR